MILDVSISCILKTSVFLFGLIEMVKHRKKRIGLYVPEELKAEVMRFLSNYQQLATLDIDTDVFTLIKQEDRNKVMSDKSLQKVVREKLIILSFKEYADHFKKLIYISSDPALILQNFKNRLFLIPSPIFLSTNKIEKYNKELMTLLSKEKQFKKGMVTFDTNVNLLTVLSQNFIK